MKKLLTLFTALLFFGSAMTVSAVDYYYRGNQNGWGATQMTTSDDGYYAYFNAKSHANNGNQNNNFKISTSTSSWNYNSSYVTRGYNNTDIKNTSGNKSIGLDWDGDNICVYCTSDFYILIYFPNTAKNSTGAPIICASTTLPHNPPTITLKADFNGWGNTDVFTDNGTTATFEKTINHGSYGFKIMVGSDWKSYKTTIARANSGVEYDFSGNPDNATLDADYDGTYTFTYTYATKKLSVAYPPLPAQSVDFSGLDAQIEKGTAVNFAATSTGVINPGYRFYVKEKNGSYGSAVTSYNFNTVGEYVVKVDALTNNTGEPVVSNEKDVVVYTTYTFTKGTRIYVDFSAMTEGAKGVNYPNNNAEDIDYDEEGAGTFKTIQFGGNVTWNTLHDFIKTAKADWAGLKFSVPGEGQNKIIVAADGASYTWGIYTPATVQVKFFAPRDESSNWDHVYAHSWDAAGDITSWPGVEITDSKANLWYAYDVQVGANVLFHNGNGMQTANIENIQAAACYEPTAIDYGADPKIVTVTTNTGCEIAYYIAGSKELVGGEADFDTNVALDENNQVVFHDVMPGTYAFKINNGTWAWAIGGYANLSDEPGCGTIATEVGTGDIGFKIDTKQDVTITYYPATQKICLGAVTVKADGEITAGNVAIEAGELKAITYWTNNTETTGATFTVLSGDEYIMLNNGAVLGVKAGEATIRISVAETANYTAATKDITVTVTTPAASGLDPIAPIGGKFIINAKGDTAVFSRGNLQYQQSSNTWRCAPNQYNWQGIGNLQMGNAEYEGWVDLFCWSIGAENNYGATSSYLSTAYHNKDFVDWGSLFAGDWSTLSIDQWYYMLYSRANANESWGMAMIGDNLGMVLLPEGWTAPSGVTFVPGTVPTTDMWEDDDCLDPTHADEDHWRINPDNLPANKFTLEQWAALEAAGAVFCPYGGRRSGGYGNHTNRDDQTVDYEYAYSYYENYQGAYWTSTVAKPAEGKAYWLPMICGGCDYAHENWGRGSHGWWENGRYGHSVRLAHIIPRQYTVTYDANGATGTLPTDAAKYLDGAAVTLASADGLHMDGFAFAGWKFKDATYNAGDAYTIANVLANEEIVFEAQWEPTYVTVRDNLTNGYYTMCLDKAATDVRGGSIWRVLSKAANGSDVMLEEVTGTLEAGRPYIFYATAANLEVLYTGDAVGAPVNDAANNGLIGSFTKEQITADANNYIIYNNELYYVNSNNVFVGANRAYLNMSDVPAYNSGAASAPGRRRVTMGVHGTQTATGLDDVQSDDVQCTKVLIDGQLYILRGEKMYDATGKMVK